LASGNGDDVAATLAFADAHRLGERERVGEVAVRAGYGLALELAHRRGIALGLRPPSHFTAKGDAPQRPRRGGAPATPAGARLPAMGLDAILRVAGTPAAGANPAARAEGTLRLMLGDEAYLQLESDGYLDVPSARHADRKRVYRLRRDPRKRRDMRVRVFEEVRGRLQYARDFCVVRASQDVPEADGYLTKWLGLLSDERSIVDVVQAHNIFPPHSDGYLEETTPPVWRPPRGALVA